MFPIDVTLIPVKWGSFLTPTGQLPRRVTVQVSPVLGEGTSIVWAATGDTLTTFRAVARDSDEVEFTVPAVDQAGWRDNTGAAFSEWSYEARAFVDFGSGVVEYTKFFQVREAYASLDLALVPDGVPADPSVTPLPPVTSVNGLFGDVVIPQIEGKSAYEVAVENGFVGTEAQWLESLESTVPGPANSLAIGTVVEGASPDATITGVSPNQTLNLTLKTGDTGPPNTLAIGTVVEGPTAGATITGTSPSQTLNLVLPEADPGPPNTLSIGTVGSGGTPAATITGTSPNQTLNLTLVPGAGVPTTGNTTGDLLRWNGSVWIQTATKFHEGTGNPNGVVSAPVGSTFVNTETGGFNGARRWTKATGSGNTGWVVVDGDTGWRDITPYMSNLDAANTGTAKAKRVGKQVTYAFNNVLLASGSGSLLIYNGVPAGYRPASESNGFAFGYLSRHDNINILQLVFCNTSVIQWRVEQNMNPPIATTTTRPTSGVSGQFTIHTIEDWPTALW